MRVSGQKPHLCNGCQLILTPISPSHLGNKDKNQCTSKNSTWGAVRLWCGYNCVRYVRSSSRTRCPCRRECAARDRTGPSTGTSRCTRDPTAVCKTNTDNRPQTRQLSAKQTHTFSICNAKRNVRRCILGYHRSKQHLPSDFMQNTLALHVSANANVVLHCVLRLRSNCQRSSLSLRATLRQNAKLLRSVLCLWGTCYTTQNVKLST